jgi:enoyl-CoA hydratase/carnithine racemase
LDEGQGLARAEELAARIAANAPLTNFAVMHALPRIAGQPMTEGFLTEAMMAAISSGAPETKERLKAILEKRAGKVGK